MASPLTLVAWLLAAPFAWADDVPAPAAEVPPPPPEEETDPFADEESAWAALDAIPPEASWEFAVEISYSDITYWQTGFYPGFGFRGGWGKHLGSNRVGLLVSGNLAGPVPLYWVASVEPAFAWDRVGHGMLIGASVGPAVLFNGQLGYDKTEVYPTVSPSVGVRLGFSQPWTRLGRRVFVVLEPKVRYVSGQMSPMVTLLVGQGRGR